MDQEINAFGQPVGRIVEGWKPPPWPTRDPLSGRYCRVECLDAARHAPSLHAANQGDVRGAGWTYLPYGPFEDLAAYRRWMEDYCSGKDPQFYAIVDQGSQEARGVGSFMQILPASGSIEVGHLHFSPRLQRTPAATEALYLMMAWAFDSGYRRFQWRCNALNGPSRAAAERLGLSFEGIWRQATVWKGRTRDTAWYSAIDSEWPALRQALQTWLDPSNFDASGKQKTRLSEKTAPLRKSRVS
jgi:RimJ/RimL family protein N-acetyltransferase